jgi:large conductance mechanosensitive channel
MLKEFREFAMRGNVMDMAVGIVIGAAFGSIVTSFVSDIIMPPIGLILGNIDFSNFYLVLKHGAVPGPYPSLAEAKKAGAVLLGYGPFINTVVSFVILAFIIFLFIRSVNRFNRKQAAAPAAPTTKECGFCFTSIPIKATRCPHCTSELKTM